MTNTPGDQPEPPQQPGYWEKQAQEQQPPQQPPQPPYGQQPYGQQPYGTPYPMPYTPYAAPPPNDGQAVAAMVIGIIGLVGACGYGLGTLISPVALFLGRASMNRIDASGGQLGGRGMAQAGFILGIIGTVLLGLAVLAFLAIFGVAVSGGFES